MAAKQNQELLLANHFKSINLGEPTGQIKTMLTCFPRRALTIYESMYERRRQRLSDPEGNEDEALGAQMELNEVNDILDEDVDNSDLAQLLPPDEETRVEETKRTSILLNETVPQDPPAEAMSMSWILPLPQMDEHLGGRMLSVVPPCCPHIPRYSSSSYG